MLATRWASVHILKSRLPRGAAVRGAAPLSLRQVTADPARVGDPAVRVEVVSR